MKIKDSTFHDALEIKHNSWKDGTENGRLIVEDCTINGDFNFNDNNVSSSTTSEEEAGGSGSSMIVLKDNFINGAITMYDNVADEFSFPH